MQAIKTDTKRDDWIRKAAKFLLGRFEYRFPLTADIIATALLDPEIQHLPAIDNWLEVNKETRLTLLNRVALEHEININQELQQTQQHKSTLPPNDIRSILIKKHSILSKKKSTLEDEMLRFLNITDQTSDVLSFWRENNSVYPNLAKIAKVLLAKPATSAKAESAFSVAGAMLRSRRATIDPLRAQKALFIHDNFDLLKSDFQL